MESGNTNYDSRDNCNAIIETGTNKLIKGTNNSIIPNSVTAIGDKAFEGCSGLTSITIPNNVTTIGTEAFRGCTGLTSITIPNNVTVIGYRSFMGCTGLTSVTIPNSVTTIGTKAFFKCTDLTSVTVKIKTPLTIVEDVFSNRANATLYVPAGSKAAYEAKNYWKEFGTILEVDEHSTFTAKTVEGYDMVFTVLDEDAKICQVGYLDASWDERAVDKEIVKGSLTIPETANGYKVVKIGKNSLNNIDGMTSVTIPNTVTSIDDDAFFNCEGLESFELPASVTSLGTEALSAFWNDTSVKVADGNPKYDSRDNCNAIIETATNKLLFGFKTTIIPATVTEIGERAFFNIMRSYTLTIPSTITKIGGDAFGLSSNLTLQVEHTTPLVISESVFEGLSNSTLRVPAGCKAAYAASTGWNKFDNIIEETKVSKNVETAGTLSQLISDEEKFAITDLTLTGNLNGTDLRLLREMAGNDYTGQPTEGKLQKLDLSGAKIVAGGDAYIDLDHNFINLGNNNYYYGFDDEPRTSEANTFGEYLFAGCQQLESVKTPTSLVKIGDKVFAESGLTSIDLNTGLTTLDPYAFWDSKLSSITIPNTVIHIGDKYSVDNPFSYIDELTSITLEAGNTRYAMAAEGKLLIDTQRNAVVSALGKATIPEGITWIGQNAFCNRPELVNFTIPNWVKQIGGNSFSQCYNLESVVISNQMTTISNSAFTDCPKLTSVTIPSSVTKIMYNALGNTGLTEIIIPSSVTSIEGQAFAHNQNLTTVISYITNPLDIDDDVFAKGWDLSNTTYPETLKVPYGTKALYEAKTGWNKIANIVEMGQAPTITAKTTEGWDMVFTILDENAKTCQVGYLDGSESKTAVDKDAVDGAVTIPETVNGYTVVKIGSFAFSDITGMTSVTIPAIVSSLDYGAFQGCHSLVSVTVMNPTPVAITEEVFTNRANATLYVPAGCKAAYEAADYWKEFKEIRELEPVYATWTDSNGMEWSFTVCGTEAKDIKPACQKVYIYGADPVQEPPFQPGSWDAAAMRFSSTEGAHLPTIPDDVYASLKTLIFDVSDVSPDFDLKVMNGWWSNTYYDHVVWEDGLNELQITETMANDCAKGGGGRDLDLMLYSGTVTLNAVYYETALIPEPVVVIPAKVYVGSTELTVTSIAERAFDGCSDMTSITIPNSVTSIGSGAFSSCRGLTSISIPNNVTSIGEYAFKNCINLTSVSIRKETPLPINENTFTNRTNATLYVLQGCKAAYEAADYWKEFKEIAEINTTPSSIINFADANVKAICIANWDFDGDGELSESEAASITDSCLGYVFKNKANITSFDELKFFTGLTSIGDLAFYSCWNLTSVTIPSNVTSIGNSAFDGCSGLTSVTIPNSVTSIGNSAFYACSSLASLSVEIGNTKYDSRDDCNAIIETETNTLICGTKNTVIPNSVTSIGDYAFYYCNGLTSVTIPNSVTSIGNSAFYGCNGLTSVTIPSSVTSISGSAFCYCSSLASLSVEAGNTKYDSRGDCNAIIETETNTLICGTKNTVIPNSVTSIGDWAFGYCSGLTSVTIPNSVTSIGNSAFSGCSGLTSVTIPNSVTSIGDYAFYDCSGLTSVTIPNSVTSIGNSAFYYCSGLTSVTIPNSVTSIGDWAFYSCWNLTSVTVEAKTPITISYWVFSNRAKATLYVPAECKAVYEATDYWKEFKEIIEEVVPKVKLSKNEATIEKGKTLTLKATVTPETLTDKTVTWKSSNTAVATVTSAGKVTGVKAGTATITCTSKATGAKATCKVTISYVKLDQVEAVVEKGKTVTLTATVYPSSLSDRNVTWKSSNTAVATVTSAGKVKGVKAGKATITATSKETGLKATCEVTVGYVKLDQAEAVIEKGKTVTLTATVYPSSLSDRSVTWKSSDTKIATVSTAGKVKGVKAGTATITCTSKTTGLKTTCTVTVGYVKLDQTEASVEKGKTLTLKATVYPSALTDKSVTWKSSNTKIATVSTAGKVKGVKAGTATITATSKATGLKTTCTVTVGYVKLDQTKATLLKGKTVTLTPTVYPSSLTDKSVTWKSSDKAVATVTSAGKVKGVKAGTATITCTSKATGLKTTCTVTVENGKVTLNKAEVRVQKGKTVTLKATVTPSSLKDKSVTWKSSNTKIATVTAEGKVKGIKAGTATITCTSNATGKKATCTVTVLQNMASLPFNGDEMMEDQEMDNSGVEEPFDVYDLNGRKVKSQVTSLDGLPRGIYIINGKKVMKH